MAKREEFKNGHIVLALIIAVALQFAYIQYRIHNDITPKAIPATPDVPVKTTAYASANLGFCLNTPPVLNNTCNFTIPWGYPYTCTVNVTDAENKVFTFYSQFLTNQTLFNIMSNGTINFTPQKSQIGNHTVKIVVYDDSGCENNYNSQDYLIEIYNLVHPATLVRPIPNKTFNSIGERFIFQLNDYFVDPDGDPLNYSITLVNANGGGNPSSIISVAIANDSTATVTAAGCGAVYATYFAEDPGGLITPSNLVQYAVNCPITSQSTGSGSGSAGGGGSGAVSTTTASTCHPHWVCGDWSGCTVNGTMSMTCTDLAGCDANDYQNTYYKNCTYVPETYQCTENWNCTAWSSCINGNQTRLCLDLNSCGTVRTKPNETISCGQISCFDGIQDGDETGVDCGGSCKSCAILESPLRATPTNILVVSAIVFAISLLGVLTYASRKEVSTRLQSILKKWYMLEKRPVYLAEKDKKALIDIWELADRGYAESNRRMLMTAISRFSKEYFKKTIEVGSLSAQEFTEKTKTLQDKDLLAVYQGLFHALTTLQTSKQAMDELQMRALLDEMLQGVYMVAAFTPEDAAHCVKERKIDGTSPAHSCASKLANLWIALEFSQVALAKDLYREISAQYSKLNAEEQKTMYPAILRAFNTIKYREKYQHD